VVVVNAVVREAAVAVAMRRAPKRVAPVTIRTPARQANHVRRDSKPSSREVIHAAVASMARARVRVASRAAGAMVRVVAAVVAAAAGARASRVVRAAAVPVAAMAAAAAVAASRA
jgi:hypothetical protein